MPDRLLISDANIIIDLVAGELLDQLFQLPYEFGTPNTLFNDELAEFYPELPDRGLQLLELTEESIARVLQLGQQYNGVSSYDVEALALAEQEQVPLLTGDGKLRKVGLEEDVEVRGTVWIVEQMLIHGLINTEQAKIAFDSMENEGSRLPWDKVEELLSSYE